jgi:small subunit ribosomal protein S4
MRYLDSKCKLCRREGKKLFLKGERCYSPKCPLDKKGAVPPGVHGPKQTRKRVSNFGIQLREKQKAKRIYGVSERQFNRYFNQAAKKGGETGELLMKILESRLDSVVFRLGFTASRSIARQAISHGHILVDGKKVNVASYQLKPGQTVSLTTKGLKIDQVKKMLANKDYRLPKWLKRKAAVGKIDRLPKREEIDSEVDEKLIVEYHSR